MKKYFELAFINENEANKLAFLSIQEQDESTVNDVKTEFKHFHCSIALLLMGDDRIIDNLELASLGRNQLTVRKVESTKFSRSGRGNSSNGGGERKQSVGLYSTKG